MNWIPFAVGTGVGFCTSYLVCNANKKQVEFKNEEKHNYSMELKLKAFEFERAKIDYDYTEKQLALGNPLAWPHRDPITNAYNKAKKDLVEAIKKEKIERLTKELERLKKNS